MPLTHLKPPAPARALHVSEVDQFAEEFASNMDDFLWQMLHRIMYPRTTWSRGTGNSAGAGTVNANANARSNDPSPTAVSYETGAIRVESTKVAGRAVMLAGYVDDTDPIPQRRSFFDGILLGIVPSTVAPASPPQAPARPEPAEIDSEETYHAHVRAWGDYFADLAQWFIEDQLARHWYDVTRYWWGVAQSVNKSSHTVRVLLDAIGDTEQVEKLCGFGTHMWTTDLVGHRVRVGYDRQIGWWVDDWE